MSAGLKPFRESFEVSEPGDYGDEGEFDDEDYEDEDEEGSEDYEDYETDDGNDADDHDDDGSGGAGQPASGDSGDVLADAGGTAGVREFGEESKGKDETEGDVDVRDLEEGIAWDRSQIAEPTWNRIMATVRELVANGVHTLTLVFVGRSGNGRSSTINSLLGDPGTAPIASLPGQPQGQQSQRQEVPVYIRVLQDMDNFMLRLVDAPSWYHAPGTALGGTLDVEALERLAGALGPRRVTALVLVDRLDVQRVEPADRSLWRALTRHFGRAIWRNAVVCLTHGSASPPDGYTADEYVARRQAQLAAALRREGARDVRFALVENISRCYEREGEKVLAHPQSPDYRSAQPWLSELWKVLADAAFAPEAGAQLHFRPYNPNRRRLWMIPFALALQYLAYRYGFEPVIEADGWKGDKNGEYDPETAKEERLLERTRKEQQEREAEVKQRVEEQKRAQAAGNALSGGTQARGAAVGGTDGDEEDDEGTGWDDEE